MDDMPEHFAHLWRLDEPTARDVAFRCAVLARMERHRFRSGMVDLLLLSVAVGLVAWLFAPAVDSVIQGLNAPLTLTVILGLIAILTPEGDSAPE